LETSAEVGTEIDQESHEEAPTNEEVNMILNLFTYIIKVNLQYAKCLRKKSYYQKFIYLDCRGNRRFERRD